MEVRVHSGHTSNSGQSSYALREFPRLGELPDTICKGKIAGGYEQDALPYLGEEAAVHLRRTTVPPHQKLGSLRPRMTVPNRHRIVPFEEYLEQYDPCLCAWGGLSC